MSGGLRCVSRQEHRSAWVVTVRKANYSAFNGYQRTTSDYSQIHCGRCQRTWRGKAAYVDSLLDAAS